MITSFVKVKIPKISPQQRYNTIRPTNPVFKKDSFVDTIK